MGGSRTGASTAAIDLAVGEAVILLHPPPPLVGVSIWMERERQQNDSLADGWSNPSKLAISSRVSTN